MGPFSSRSFLLDFRKSLLPLEVLLFPFPLARKMGLLLEPRHLCRCSAVVHLHDGPCPWVTARREEGGAVGSSRVLGPSGTLSPVLLSRKLGFSGDLNGLCRRLPVQHPNQTQPGPKPQQKEKRKQTDRMTASPCAACFSGFCSSLRSACSLPPARPSSSASCSCIFSRGFSYNQ